MTKAELITQIAEKSELSKKDSEKALAAVISSITEALTNGDKVQLVGFGTFEIRDRKEKESKNPRTGEKSSFLQRRLLHLRLARHLRML